MVCLHDRKYGNSVRILQGRKTQGMFCKYHRDPNYICHYPLQATILRRPKEKASQGRPPIYITALTLGNV
jgi:hypothetical protein